MLLLQRGLSQGTSSNYAPGLSLYLQFCSSHRAPFPPTAEALIAFATYLFAFRNVPRAAVRLRLTALRSACVDCGADLAPFADPRIARLFAGMARSQPSSSPSRPTRQALSGPTLAQLVSSLPPTSPRNRSLRAGLALGFFGLLRAGEFTSRGPGLPTLLRQHVTWRPSSLTIFLSSSKTDRAHKGVSIRIFKSGSSFCAYSLLRSAWDLSPVRSPGAPLLQVDGVGSPLGYRALLDCIKKGVIALGLNPDLFGAHSLRIGGASQLARSNFTEAQIQAIGRWSSECYQRYLRFDDAFFQSVASSLGASSSTAPSYGHLPRSALGMGVVACPSVGRTLPLGQTPSR